MVHCPVSKCEGEGTGERGRTGESRGKWGEGGGGGVKGRRGSQGEEGGKGEEGEERVGVEGRRGDKGKRRSKREEGKWRGRGKESREKKEGKQKERKAEKEKETRKEKKREKKREGPDHPQSLKTEPDLDSAITTYHDHHLLIAQTRTRRLPGIIENAARGTAATHSARERGSETDPDAAREFSTRENKNKNPPPRKGSGGIL